MKTALVCFLFLLSSNILAQFTIFEHKGKVGIKFNDEIIIKSKLDSVVGLNQKIVTAYKKKKAFYYDQQGERIYKSKIDRSYPFTDGLAIIRKPKKYWSTYGAINDSGKICIDYVFNEFPQQFGVILSGTYFDRYHLYAPYSELQENYDSLSVSNDTLTTFEFGYAKTYNVKHHSTRTDHRYGQSYFNEYDINTGKVIFEDVHRKYQSKNHIVYQNFYGVSTLIDENRKTIISDKCDTIIVKKNTIHVQKFGNRSQAAELTIFDLSGNKLKSNIRSFHNLHDGRYVFSIDSLGTYIANEKGDQLSPYFNDIGDATEGWRLVYHDFTYTYMNDSTYELKPFEFPLVAEVHASGMRTDYNGVVRNRVGNLGKRFGNFGRTLIGKKKKTITRENPQVAYKGWTDIYEKGANYKNGLAVVCLKGLNEHNDYPDFVEGGKFGHRNYNVINHSGELLNNEEYRAIKISNDHFAGLDVFDWFIIDRNGERVTEYGYDEIIPQENGYYLTKLHSFSDYGLLDSNFNLVIEPKYRLLQFEGNNLISVNEEHPEKNKIIWTIPE